MVPALMVVAEWGGEHRRVGRRGWRRCLERRCQGREEEGEAREAEGGAAAGRMRRLAPAPALRPL